MAVFFLAAFFLAAFFLAVFFFVAFFLAAFFLVAFFFAGFLLVFFLLMVFLAAFFLEDFFLRVVAIEALSSNTEAEGMPTTPVTLRPSDHLKSLTIASTSRPLRTKINLSLLSRA